jgi:hypothetical protein
MSRQQEIWRFCGKTRVKVRNDRNYIKKCRIVGKFVDHFGEKMECFCNEAANC